MINVWKNKCMNDKMALILPSVSRALRRQGFNTEKIHMIKSAMKN